MHEPDTGPLVSDRRHMAATYSRDDGGAARLPAPYAKSTWRYVVVTFPSPRQPGKTEGPELGILVQHRQDIILWGPDYSPVPLPAGHTVLKQYPVDKLDSSTADWQRAQLQFARDFPPRAVPPHAAPAWVAPEGRFYPCRWLEHDRLGYRLAAAYYADPRGPLALERRGWLRVQHDGTVVRLPARRPTQSQLDVLFALAQSSEGIYSLNIRDELVCTTESW